MTWSWPRRSTVFMAVLLAGGGVCLFFFSEQQRALWVNLTSRIEAQQIALEDVLKDMPKLRAQFNDVVAAQNARFDLVESESREVKALLPEMRSSIEQIKAVISQSRVEALMIKDDVRQWQKDYVAVLLELEERLNVSDKTLKDLEERLQNGAMEQVRHELDSLKAGFQTLSTQLSLLDTRKAPSASPYAAPLPRFDPDWKK